MLFVFLLICLNGIFKLLMENEMKNKPLQYIEPVPQQKQFHTLSIRTPFGLQKVQVRMQNALRFRIRTDNPIIKGK